MRSIREFLSQERNAITDFKGCSISVLENPKPKLLAEEHTTMLDGLLSDLQVLTAESFGTELERHSCDGVRDHIVNVDALAFLHDGDNVLGFASSKRFPQDDSLFYLHGVAIANAFKGNGGSVALIKTLMGLTPSTKSAFTSQNPIMFCALRNMCSRVYPSPEQASIPLELERLGTDLVSGRPGDFDPKTFVAKNLYGRCLYNGLPDCRDREVDLWFSNVLGTDDRRYTRNAFLFIGEGYR